jgi:hypothetical protein
MKTIRLVNLHDEKECDYKIDRSSPLGNPYALSKTETREIVCGKYKEYLKQKILERDQKITSYITEIALDAINKNDKQEITLGCWCVPNLCHGYLVKETIEKIINNIYVKKQKSDAVNKKIFIYKRRINKNENIKGYEVSSVGDKRFSALYAKMPDNRTIEMHYQCDVKGYMPGGTNFKLGKGKPPINKNMSEEQLYNEYLHLWKTWMNSSQQNTNAVIELKKKLNEQNIYTLTDAFASSNINQARALSDILNNECGI